MNKIKKIVLFFLLLWLLDVAGAAAQNDTVQTYLNKVDMAYNDILKISRLPDDTTIMYFTNENFVEIKKQLPDSNNIYYFAENECIDYQSIFYELVFMKNLNYAINYFQLYIDNSTKTSMKKFQQQQLENSTAKQTEQILFEQRLVSGEKFKISKYETIYYEKIDSVNELITKIFPNVSFYYLNSEDISSLNRINKYIFCVYKNKKYTISDFNQLFKESNTNQEFEFEEVVRCLIMLYENNLNCKMEVVSIKNITKQFENNPNDIYNVEVETLINDNKIIYYLTYKDGQFLNLLKTFEGNRQISINLTLFNLK